jgi:hypothetical protein
MTQVAALNSFNSAHSLVSAAAVASDIKNVMSVSGPDKFAQIGAIHSIRNGFLAYAIAHKLVENEL